jgi:hypothetical protein
MIRQRKRAQARKLNKIQEGVRPDWLSHKDLQEVPRLLSRIAADRRIPIRVVAKVYAAAIVQEGLDGAVDWVQVGRGIQTRARLGLRDPMGLVKALAWREIRRAKARQAAQARGLSFARPKPPSTRPRPAWAILARLVAFILSAALAILGLFYTFKAVGMGITWGLDLIRGAK